MKKKRNGRSGKLPGLRKMVLMMKLCVFFLFASFLSVAANGYSQNTRLSLMKQNASVIEVLTEISQKTDMQFLYNDNELQGIQVNVSLKNATLYEMLDKIFAGLPLSYSILDSVIVISPKGKPLPQALKTVTITGQIKDKDGNPLPGATVRIKDTQMGVVSDQDGKFKLEVGEIKDLMLQVSFIGYKTQTVKSWRTEGSVYCAGGGSSENGRSGCDRLFYQDQKFLYRFGSNRTGRRIEADQSDEFVQGFTGL